MSLIPYIFISDYDRNPTFNEKINKKNSTLTRENKLILARFEQGLSNKQEMVKFCTLKGIFSVLY